MGVIYKNGSFYGGTEFPIASETKLGGIIVGDGLSVSDSGYLSAKNITKIINLSEVPETIEINNHEEIRIDDVVEDSITILSNL